MRKLLSLIALFLVHNSYCQGLPIGSWRTHLAYNDGIHAAEVGNKIYVVTKTGMFYVDKDQMVAYGLSKVDGFSDIDTRTVTYDPGHKALFVGYQSGNMDILIDNTIYHVPGMQEKNLVVNSFYPYKGYCYISTSGGIIQYNTAKGEFGDSYQYITPKSCNKVNVSSTTIMDSFLYAATDSGIIRGNLGNILQDCSNWEKISNDSSGYLLTYQGKMFAACQGGFLKYWNGSAWTTFYRTATGEIQSMEIDYGNITMANEKYIYTIHPDFSVDSFSSNGQNYAVIDNEGRRWACKNGYGIVLEGEDKLHFFRPAGPASNSVGNLYSNNGEIWVSPSTVTSQGAPSYNNDPISLFDEGWYIISPPNVKNGFPLKDIMKVIKDSVSNHYWIASLDSGVAEFDIVNNQIVSFYNSANSALEPWEKGKTYSQVSDVITDMNDNLWVANYRAQNILAVRKPKGNWYHFSVGTNKDVLHLMADQYGYIWAVAPHNSSLFIYNPGAKIESTDDDQVAELQTGVGSGNLPSSNVNCVVQDLNGQVWIGTANGVTVYPDPSLLFASHKYDAQQPWVQSGGTAGPLLNYIFVTCIAVDGANRKWIGTTDGVFLTSEDGTAIIEHFTVDNSPLLSSTITSIAINGKTGEVFFGTDKGIVSYRSTATEGKTENSNVYAYPNPVHPGYKGPIAINGLVRNASVKITDVTGNVVYETNALGGQAIWDGKNFKGEEAHSGVYLVFVTNADGSETTVTKILVVR